MNGRISNKNDSTDTYQNDGKKDDEDVTARELPPEPSHRSFPGVSTILTIGLASLKIHSTKFGEIEQLA
jgi:hypothetical protein